MIMLHHEGLNRWPSTHSKAFSSRQAVTVLDVAHCKAPFWGWWWYDGYSTRPGSILYHHISLFKITWDVHLRRQLRASAMWPASTVCQMAAHLWRTGGNKGQLEWGGCQAKGSTNDWWLCRTRIPVCQALMAAHTSRLLDWRQNNWTLYNEHDHAWWW